MMLGNTRQEPWALCMGFRVCSCAINLTREFFLFIFCSSHLFCRMISCIANPVLKSQILRNFQPLFYQQKYPSWLSLHGRDFKTPSVPASLFQSCTVLPTIRPKMLQILSICILATIGTLTTSTPIPPPQSPPVKFITASSELPDGWSISSTPLPSSLMSVRLDLTNPLYKLQFEKDYYNIFSNTSSPRYLSKPQKADLLKPLPATTAAVLSWLWTTAHIPAGNATQTDSNEMDVTCTVAAANRLLDAEYHDFSGPARDGSGRDETVMGTLSYALPGDVSRLVLSVEPSIPRWGDEEEDLNCGLVCEEEPGPVENWRLGPAGGGGVEGSTTVALGCCLEWGWERGWERGWEWEWQWGFGRWFK